MGQAKKMWMDFEMKLSILQEIIAILSNDSLGKYFNSNVVIDFIKIQEMINSLDSASMDDIQLIIDLFDNEFHDVYSELTHIMSSISPEEELNPILLSEAHEIIRKLQVLARRIRNRLETYISRQQSIYNSEKYYNEQIKELEKQQIELKNFLNHQKNIEGKSKEEIEQHKKSIREKELALLKANEQIKSYQKELEEKKKKENVIVEWNSKIKSTFDELTDCLTPIKTEHSRLTIMFWIYTSLTTVLILSIVLLEIYIFNKLNESSGFPEWENYLASIVPIPVFGGLLWAFIIQLNRTQRQLVILAKHIHEIRYVEGLSLAINSLSPDINNSTKRVNSAIDRLLENHLNSSAECCDINEEKIRKEEQKDLVPIDMVLKLLKETKEVIKK